VTKVVIANEFLRAWRAASARDYSFRGVITNMSVSAPNSDAWP